MSLSTNSSIIVSSPRTVTASQRQQITVTLHAANLKGLGEYLYASPQEAAVTTRRRMSGPSRLSAEGRHRKARSLKPGRDRLCTILVDSSPSSFVSRSYYYS